MRWVSCQAAPVRLRDRQRANRATNDVDVPLCDLDSRVPNKIGPAHVNVGRSCPSQAASPIKLVFVLLRRRFAVL